LAGVVEDSLKDVVTRLTKVGRLDWTSITGKSESIILSSKAARGLVSVLLVGAQARLDSESGTEHERITDEQRLFELIETSWTNDDDEDDTDIVPDQDAGGPTNQQPRHEVWLLEEVRTIGFGGLNGANAKTPFILGLGDGSTCILGGNGCGKSSLIGAIAWALTGQRLTDAAGLCVNANELEPVFDAGATDTVIAEWAPIAAYPTTRQGYVGDQEVSVSLIFRLKGTDRRASIVRRWIQSRAPETTVAWDPSLESLRSCLDVAVEMPLRMSRLRLGQVVGQSAEPVALDGQYLIIAPVIRTTRELLLFDGKPVVALTGERSLFKRLRVTSERGPVVLESLDASGRYPPIVINVDEPDSQMQASFRPVLGVLFDSPA